MSLARITFINQTRYTSVADNGFEKQLVFEASKFDPATQSYNRVDARSRSRVESTLIDTWQTIDIAVPVVTHGFRSLTDPDALSESYDFEVFFESAGTGQSMTLDATDIGGIGRTLIVQMSSNNNKLTRRGQRQKYSAAWSMRILL